MHSAGFQKGAGQVILLVVIALQFVGDGLRDLLDPRMRHAISQRDADRHLAISR